MARQEFTQRAGRLDTRGGGTLQYSWFLIKRISEAAAPWTPPAYFPRAASLLACWTERHLPPAVNATLDNVTDKRRPLRSENTHILQSWHRLLRMHLEQQAYPINAAKMFATIEIHQPLLFCHNRSVKHFFFFFFALRPRIRNYTIKGTKRCATKEPCPANW